MVYNPFEKPIREQLDVADLQRLVTLGVAEGFHVEYKSDFPNSKKIARTIASFANTYGGWYFIGIETDQNNIANNICGFDHTLHNDPIAKVRDPARLGLSHMPLMFPQVIELTQTHSAIAIYIPEGNETPYITKDGRIYRRAGTHPTPYLNLIAIQLIAE